MLCVGCRLTWGDRAGPARGGSRGRVGRSRRGTRRIAWRPYRRLRHRGRDRYGPVDAVAARSPPGLRPRLPGAVLPAGEAGHGVDVRRPHRPARRRRRAAGPPAGAAAARPEGGVAVRGAGRFVTRSAGRRGRDGHARPAARDHHTGGLSNRRFSMARPRDDRRAGVPRPTAHRRTGRTARHRPLPAGRRRYTVRAGPHVPGRSAAPDPARPAGTGRPAPAGPRTYRPAPGPTAAAAAEPGVRRQPVRRAGDRRGVDPHGGVRWPAAGTAALAGRGRRPHPGAARTEPAGTAVRGGPDPAVHPADAGRPGRARPAGTRTRAGRTGGPGHRRGRPDPVHPPDVRVSGVRGRRW